MNRFDTLGQQGFDPFQVEQDEEHLRQMRAPAVRRAINAHRASRGRPNRPVFVGSASDLEQLLESGVARSTRGMFRGILNCGS